jgi:hypothetical protein
MITMNDISKSNLFSSVVLGMTRGLAVQTIIHPLEVIKTQLQCEAVHVNSYQVALQIFKKQGMNGFYNGLRPKLFGTCLSQAWRWPMIIGIPPILERYQIGSLQQQAITGIAIASSSVLTTPLEKARIKAIVNSDEKKQSIIEMYKAGWRGFTIHWTKLSVNWSAFLISQKVLRDRAKKPDQIKLSFSQLALIGTQVALIVSVASAPFDVAHTLKQAKDLSPMQIFSENIIQKMFRGFPLSAAALIIQNIASIILLEKLSPAKSF